MATLSEYAAKVRNFYWEEMICDIDNLEDSEAENMVNIAISHVSIAFNLLDQANMANHRWLVQQSSDARKMEEAYETLND
tara:strand:- start:23 stop:262 length:240 start_codon:yes stop_codon:yes gene_type:complete